MAEPAATERWRLFVAVPTTPELRSVLAETVSALRARPGADDDWRWTDADAWHLTLAFLGGTQASRVPELRTALTSAVAGFEPFVADAGGLGAFPLLHRARVLWYGVTDPQRRLHDLAQAMRDGVGAEPGPFRAHLTIGRARDRVGTDAARLLASPHAATGKLPVDRVVLYRSHLGVGPARYEALFEAPLGAAVTAGSGAAVPE